MSSIEPDPQKATRYASQPRASSGYLPSNAYFASGAGSACSAISSACSTAGFTSISGGASSDKAAEFWITPPGEPRTRISPPGTASRRLYDLNSQIQIVASH